MTIHVPGTQSQLRMGCPRFLRRRAAFQFDLHEKLAYEDMRLLRLAPRGEPQIL